MSTQQKAFVILEAKGKVAVASTTIPEPGPGEVLVEVRAAAINPVDWVRHATGMFISSYPCVLGDDSAGVVVKLGEGVTNVAVGDRVFHQGDWDNRQATFQQFTVAPSWAVAKIPPNLSFEEASTIPLAMATAGLGLYGKTVQPYDGPEPWAKYSGGLELFPPWEEGGRGKYSGQPILITGGSTSVGQFAIQFAKLSGFSPIITTSSKHNETYLKSIGATHVIDRSVPLSELAATVREITSKPIKAAYDAVSSEESQNTVYDILAPGGKAMLFNPFKVDKAKLTVDKEVVHVYGDVKIPTQHAIGRSMYNKLTGLLATGDLKSSRFELLPKGFDSVSEGMERLKAGKVSGMKLVIRPQDTPELLGNP